MEEAISRQAIKFIAIEIAIFAEERILRRI
jgi:hypothetical protein